MKKVIIILVLILLAGCKAAHYKFEKCEPVINEGEIVFDLQGQPILICFKAEIKSRREAKEGVSLQINPKTGLLKLETGSVTTQSSLVEQLGETSLMEILKTVREKL